MMVKRATLLFATRFSPLTPDAATVTPFFHAPSSIHDAMLMFITPCACARMAAAGAAR